MSWGHVNMSWGHVNMSWGHVNMSWELDTMFWESHIVSIKPLSMYRYTFTMSMDTFRMSRAH
jgi:hypothetical protein